MREHDLRVVGSPRIDKGDEGEFSFVATVEVVPDFGDIDVSKLTVVATPPRSPTPTSTR